MNITKIKGTLKEFKKEVKGLKKVGKIELYVSKDGKKLVELYKKDEKNDIYWWRVKIIEKGVSVTSAGYQMIYTRFMGQQQVHRLVAQAWLRNGDEKIEKYEVNHKNGEKLDNNYTNLEFVTHAENMQKARDMGLISNPVYKARYYKKRKEILFANGDRKKMEPEEYINWRRENKLPIKGWMIQYMYV